jgi:branched-chain amino acid transport system substrate-binding protein
VPRRLLLAATAALACAGLVLGAAGCGGSSRTPRRSARTLSIYTSLPFEGPYATQAEAIYHGEELAWAQTGGVVNGFKVVLRRLDDANSGAGSSPDQVALNARIAAEDPSTIAYIGELTPGSSLASIRTLSPAGILQVSPGDSATGLHAKTFARAVPPAFKEAQADLAAMNRLGLKTVYLVRDRTTYGQDIAAAILQDAASYGIDVLDARAAQLPADARALVLRIKRSKARALLYAGSPGPLVAGFWNALSAADGTIKKFASATIIYSPSWDQTIPVARLNTYLSAPGLNTSRGLPRAGSEFESDFVATYGGLWPWASGIFGYVAMGGVLAALHSLGPHPRNLRGRIVSAFMRTKNLPSALGTYSIVDGQSTFEDYYFTTPARSGTSTTFVPSLP